MEIERGGRAWAWAWAWVRDTYLCYVYAPCLAQP